MRANYFLGDKRFSLKEEPIPRLQEGEILIRNMAAGICGTDVHIYHGDPGSAEVTPPVVLGHEYSGIVEEVGPGAEGVQKGDHVTVDPNIYCGRCRYCRIGKKQLCTGMKAVGVTRNGGFAEYSVVPAAQAFLLDKSVSFISGAMTEPTACCLRGIDRAGIQAGDRVMIVGGGAIGLIMLQLARLSGAGELVLSEPNPMRRKAALSLGADAVIDPLQKQDAASFEGFADVVIECAGNSAAVEQSFAFADKGANLVLFSVPRPDAVYGLKLFDVYQKELRISGSFVNPDTHARAVSLINTGKIRFQEIVTHVYPLSKLEEALHMQMSEESIKVVVDPWKEEL